MTLVEYLAKDDHTYRYVGTIWGDGEKQYTGRELSIILRRTGVDGTLADEGDPGWRILANGRAITYRVAFVEETVLIRKD